MTISMVFVVKDRAIESFGRPFFVQSLAAAERSFGDEVNNPESVIALHPEDYDLYCIGEYDEWTGRIETSPAVLVCRAQDLKREVRPG